MKNDTPKRGNAIRLRIFTVLVILFILFTWLGGFWVAKSSWFNGYTNDPINDVFSSLNALFAGLAFAGLIITVLLQKRELALQRKELALTREELKKTTKANEELVTDNREKAILELYHMYTTLFFEQTRISTWRVLENCVRSKTYCDFVVASFFVAGEKDFGKVVDLIRASYPKELKTNREIKEMESADRIKLDSLFNFYNVLANRKAPKEVLRRFEFYYDWWRPLFWWVLYLREKKFSKEKDLRKYSVKPEWTDMLRKLDEGYGFEPFETPNELWKYLVNHPRLKRMTIDQEYFEMDELKEKV